jgi:DNA-binding LacI/PurR family transcriptional regulator
MATRADVAKLAGVSTSTVSYVLSGVRPISDQTRERVLNAMRELGYTPNVLASGLAGRRSKILALLFPSLPRTIGGSDMEYVVAAADAARERGYHVVLWTTRDGDLDDVRVLAGSGLVDGVLLMEVRMDDERVRFLQSAGVPLALIGRTADPDGMTYADADFDSLAALAVQHLAALGHRHVGLLNASQRLLDLGYGPVTRMAAAVVAATEAAGLTHAEVACEQTFAGGRAAFAAMTATAPAATAVIAFNWEATVGLLQAAREAGVSIPEHLSVISVSSAYQAELTFPPLTTVTIPAVGIGRAAALGLIKRLEQPDSAPGQVLLAGPLVERGSTARPR